MNQLQSVINTVLKNRGRKEVFTMNESTHLRNDIGFDSLDLAELTIRIEAEYDIDIFEDGIVNTVGEIMQKIKR